MKTEHMQRISLKDRLRYQFDNIISKGVFGLFAWLFVLSVLFIGTMALIVVATGIDPNQRSYGQMAWASLLRTLNTGVLSRDEGNWLYLLAMWTLTMGGIILVSTTIGVVTTALKSKLEDLRRGRSFVAEEGHTLILGWSPQIFTIIKELVLANANQARSCIVILADKDKVKMEDEIRAKVGHIGHTRIVCRTGNPADPGDLQMVNPHATRSIMVLSPDGKDPDTDVISIILAVVHDPQRRPEPHHITAVIRDPKNIEAARLIGRDEVQLVQAGEVIARIAAQTCRESGLSVAYADLLGFSGDEIYFQQEPQLTGKTFGEALLSYEDSAIIGIRFADGRVQLNPPMDTRFEQGASLIAVAGDDDTIRLAGQSEAAIDTGAIRDTPTLKSAPDRTLLLGWNKHAYRLIEELDQYVVAGSVLMVVAEAEDAARVTLRCTHLRNLSVTFQSGNVADRQTLDALDIPSYQHVVVLSYADTLEAARADAHTMVTLLHLRAIADQQEEPFSIVSEILDAHKRQLAEVARPDDFIISDNLTSLLLLQISENRDLAAVFADLFDPEGTELHFKPVSNYVVVGRPVNFYTVVESARRRGEVAVGYRLQSQAYDPARTYGVKLNPVKSQMVTFSEKDRIIVLSDG